MKIADRLAPRALGGLLLLAAGGLSALPARPPKPPRPDVVLITIDTLRADALGFAGNRRAQTPVLDRLAASGRVFPDAHAHNVATLPSHTNILTGLYPYQHGVRDNSGFRLAGSVPTLATVLHAAGYATGAFVGGFTLDSQFGLGHGFDVYDDRTSRGSETEGFAGAERRGDEVVGAALAWWRGQKRRPRFLWVHLFDPHAPYAPPEPFASRFPGDPYHGEVAAADAFLAPLLRPFLDGREPAPFVVMTADHGEALGEHGELTHGLFAYEATLKVPLVVWGPGVAPGRDLRPARHVDVFPTVLQAAGVAAPAASRFGAYPGRSLLAAAGPAPVDSYFEALSATFNRGWAPLRGILRQGRKYIALPLPEVYDLQRDPKESHNLASAERAAAREVLAALPRESVWPPPSGQTQQEVAARLESLGYVTASARTRTRYGPEDDPKTLIGLDRKMHEVSESLGRGQAEEAVRLAREVVAQRPAMAYGQEMLVHCLLESGRTQEALAAMQEARRRGAATGSLLRQLGLTLTQVGRTDEALAVLRPLAAEGLSQSLNAYALALFKAGRLEESAATERRVLAADPGNARAHQQLGLIEIRQRHWDQARGELQKAVHFNPRLPVAWNNLGVVLYELKQPDAAFQAWQTAVDLQPNQWDTLWNLGTKAAQNGRPEQARQALERFVAGAPRRQYGDEVRQAHQYLALLNGARK
ncbi:MAG TPA: sulfatase-like hydrolase/transferase [Thermoanaerobaculia bacterium]|nr:sulfatase-like hydrolase/transferase [Thermoanaerobaculia bacterium]